MRPNIIVFFTDQQRWDTCDCYRYGPAAWDENGRPIVVMPQLSRMAAEGVRFEFAFTCQPVCGPARACLQTGKYATETGCFRNDIALPLTERTIAHELSDAGYETAYVGKWHLASSGDAADYREKPIPPERRGGYKDFWLASDVLECTSHSYDGHMYDSSMQRREFPSGRYRADVLTDWAIEYLRNRRCSRPFFLFLSFIEPHHQNDHGHYEGPTGSRERFKNFAVPGDLDGLNGDWREEYPDYLGCVNALDTNLGRIRQTLNELGIWDSTLVIFTSDHGSHFRTRNAEYKRSCHDGCTRIPLVICGPGFRGGRVARQLVSLIDVPPTILDVAGIAIPSRMKGRSLLALAQGNVPPDWREDIFMQISEDHIGRAIRTKKWKYEVWVPSGTAWSGCQQAGAAVYHEHHLYDLESDPFEKNDLVADPAFADVRSELAALLKKRMREAGEKEPEIRPAV